MYAATRRDVAHVDCGPLPSLQLQNDFGVQQLTSRDGRDFKKRDLKLVDDRCVVPTPAAHTCPPPDGWTGGMD